MTHDTSSSDSSQHGRPTRRSVLIVGAVGASALLAADMFRPWAASARAFAPVAASINVDTSTALPLQKGLVGYNVHVTNRAYHFTDASYRSLVAQLQPRWGRWSAGTANNVFDSRTGTMPEERRAQMFDKRNQYYGYDWERRVAEGKNSGYMDLLQYYDTLRETCAGITMVINTYTGTPEEAADLARFCANNNIIVDFWEIQNEPYLFTGGAAALPKFFNSATDYLNKAKPFHDAIRAVDSSAKSVVAYTPSGDNIWDDRMFDVTSPWWDAIVWHTYEAYDPIPGNGISFSESMQNGNWLVEEFRDRIDDNYLARSRLAPTPILQNELDVRVAGPLYNTQYNAVFNAEAVMRLTTASSDNIRMLTGAGGIPLWVLDAATDHTDDALDAAERGTTITTDSLNHDLYFKTVGVANVIINQAINNSASRWNASISGATTVSGLDDAGTAVTADALFATAYQGGFGGGTKDYALITNKSAQDHVVDFRLGGVTLAQTITATWSSSTDPQVGNTASNKTAITAQSTTYANGSAVTVPPYSVVRLEWARASSPSLPRTPRITNIEVLSGSSVRLKWWNVPNATSYTIRYGTASGVFTLTQSSATGNGTTVAGLNSASTYYFVVTATGSAGTTPNSNEVSIRSIAPTTPSNVAAIGRRGGVVNVIWRSVPRASSYVVRYGTAPGSLTQTVQAGNRAGVELPGLTGGTTYYFTVEAQNGAGSSPASTVVNAASSLSMPLTPVRLRLASPNSATSASLVWDASLVRTFRDNFEDGSASDWTASSGTWSVIDHPTPSRLTKVYASPSTGLAETSIGDTTWGNVAVEAQVEVTSYSASGTVSVLGRYVNASNYYRFVYNNGDQKFKLIKSAGGVFTTLAQVNLSDVINSTPFAAIDVKHMRMVFEAIGTNLACYVDNKVVLTAQDSAHPAGKMALGSNAQTAYFDKVQVSVDNMQGTSGTYALSRSTSPYSGYAVVASGLSSASYTDTTITAGHTYYYKVAAVKSGVTSIGNSNLLTVIS